MRSLRSLYTPLIAAFSVLCAGLGLQAVSGASIGCGQVRNVIVDATRDDGGRWSFRIVGDGRSLEPGDCPPGHDATYRLRIDEPLSIVGRWYGRERRQWYAVSFVELYRLDQAGVYDLDSPDDYLESGLPKQLAEFMDRNIVPQEYVRTFPPREAEDWEWIMARWTLREIEPAWGLIVGVATASVLTAVGVFLYGKFSRPRSMV